MASIAHFSDLLVEILKRLPPKSIGRFRCVSKAWNSFLSSSFFITLHYNSTVANTPTNQKSYFLTNYVGDLEQCVVYQPQEQQRGGGVRERAIFIDLPYSTNKLENEFGCVCFQISGVIHGVVCLTTTYDAVVWNPTIRKHISLLLGGISVILNTFVGFGFDATNSDFKVVLVKVPWCKIYSVRDGFWRRKLFPFAFKSLPHNPILHRPGCFVNGHIYWVMPGEQERDKSDNLTSLKCDCLLAFDCEREEFKTMALPPELGNNVSERLPHRWSLFNHGGMLSLLSSPKPKLEPERYELWVMEDEYSGKWRKVLTLPPDSHSALFGNDVNIMSPQRRIQLSSNDIPIRLDAFDQQPLTSQVFHKSLYLLNVKSPSPTTHDHRLSCDVCRFPSHFVGYKKTLFQSRLL